MTLGTAGYLDWARKPSAMHSMAHLTLTVPTLDNSSKDRNYPGKVRFLLVDYGLSGWTEVPGAGAWRGLVEPNVVFHIYIPEDGWRGPDGDHHTVHETVDLLGRIGRTAMPDQEAVQVTLHGTLGLWEY